MINIAILVPEHAVLQAIADPQYCFLAVNDFLVKSGGAPPFNVQLVGLNPEVKLNGNHYSVFPDQVISDIKSTDLVVIPALFGDLKMAVEANRAYIPWIKEQYESGADLASLCVGAFLLGATGLLDGKKCSTHWGFTNLFQELYPEVEVQDGAIVTEQNGIYSSGGANSYWNLLLHLVEKYADREIAILTAKYFAIDIDRDSQTAFSIFKGQKAHQDEAVKNLR